MTEHLSRRQDAPSWLDAALRLAPDRVDVAVQATPIEVLTWGDRGKPGLLFVHGNGAHADWWSFIAPFFAETHRVVAPSLSGMGGSGWRESYSVDLHAEELLAASHDRGLFDGPTKPWIVAHSFGSVVALRMLDAIAERIGGLIIVDNGARMARSSDRTPSPGRPPSFHPTREAIVTRFRLKPDQPCQNPALLRFVAETSVLQEKEGWRWKFDPYSLDTRGQTDLEDTRRRIALCPVPLSFVWGEHSVLIPPEVIYLTRALSPLGTRFVTIPAAAHHLMLDQPLAFVSAVRALVA